MTTTDEVDVQYAAYVERGRARGKVVIEVAAPGAAK